jgi:dihydropteroate synthase
MTQATYVAQSKPAETPPVFLCGRRSFDLHRPLLMGIVNTTPDSFSDGGQFSGVRQAVDYAKQLVDQGADILDIGGESTRPGAEPVSIDEELRRVLPVLEGLSDVGVPISIDTRRPQVMREALAIGVDLINDVNGFRDPESFSIAATSPAALCIMHMLGEPKTMQQRPVYADVVDEVTQFLLGQRDAFVAQGVDRARIVIDPGFGFGKTLAHNLALMQAIPSLSAQQTMLIGVSRKTMIGHLADPQTPPAPADRVAGSVAAALWAAEKGAQILRVHDVAQTVQALNVWNGLSGRST